MARMTMAAAVLAAGALGGCAGGDLGTTRQVIVHLDANPNDVAAAQQVADARCRLGGGRARLLAIVTNDAGAREVEETRPPDAVFACDPAPR